MSTQQAFSIKALISEYRRIPAKDLRAHERREAVTNQIVQDLKKHGTFFKTSAGHFYFRRSDTPKLFLIEIDTALGTMIHDRYGINPAEKREFECVMKGLETEAELRGEQVEVHRLAHYDTKTKTLYVSRFDGRVYLLDGTEIQEVKNGTDGVFFWDHNSWQPYEPAPVGNRNLFDELITGSANFCESDDLTRTDQQWVLYAWYLAQFFASLHPTKPLMLITGEKGGGKTSCLRKWLKLLFGAKADVTALEGRKQDGFVAAICSSIVVAFDNVDENIKWLPDYLAQLATGITFQLRKYYTTNEVAEFQPDCFIALTTRTPKFINGRDDVLDRTLVLHTNRRKQFSPEGCQLQAIADNRNKLWGELLSRLNRIVAGLRSVEAASDEIEFRMADFASFALTLGRIDGSEEAARSILTKLDSTSAELLLSDEPIADCLELWLAVPRNPGRKVNSAQLNNELGALDPRSWPHKNAHALGQRLSHIMDELRQKFEVSVEQDSANQNLYRFWPKLNH
jgi:hypothetical protein